MAAENSIPIIIGGSHRSGTTLLRRLLNGHPNIFCPPEIKFHKDLLSQFPDDPLAHGRLGSSIESLGLPLETWFDEFGRAFCKCYDLATRNADKKRWADKNPENAINVGHWDRLLEGRMQFLFVARDPYDIFCSMAEIGMNRVVPTDMSERASHIRSYMSAGLDFVDQNPARGRILRYESLVSNPVAVLSDLMGFLGEVYEASMLEKAHDAAHGIGLGDPKAPSYKGIAADSVGRRTRDLSRTEVGTLEPYFSEICERLGYSMTMTEIRTEL